MVESGHTVLKLFLLASERPAKIQIINISIKIIIKVEKSPKIAINILKEIWHGDLTSNSMIFMCLENIILKKTLFLYI